MNNNRFILKVMLTKFVIICVSVLEFTGIPGKAEEKACSALVEPDKFNWGLLLQISQKAPDELQTEVLSANGQKLRTNNAMWETWADDPFTFPRKPDPSHPPKWEDRNKSKALEPIMQLQFRALKLGPAKPALLLPRLVPTTGGPNHEEVHRNQVGFDFIIKNKLWYQEGLAEAFQQAIDPDGYPKGYPNNVGVTFPPDAIEVKAVWKPITEDQKGSFHWNYDEKGNLYGLTGLHIMSKFLPNWTWATWEWAGNTPDQPNGNPGRCDWYGSHDNFGSTPHFVTPVFIDGNPSGKPYPSGTLTPELLQAFKEAGFSGEWLDEWKNYRLKGSQTDFTDPTGGVTLLGNSVTEQGFVQTSSCITCHSNASVDAKGNVNPTLGFTEDGQSRDGPPNSAWFYDVNTYDSTRGYVLKYYPIDFIWAIFRAQPASQ